MVVAISVLENGIAFVCNQPLVAEEEPAADAATPALTMLDSHDSSSAEEAAAEPEPWDVSAVEWAFVYVLAALWILGHLLFACKAWRRSARISEAFGEEWRQVPKSVPVEALEDKVIGPYKTL